MLTVTQYLSDGVNCFYLVFLVNICNHYISSGWIIVFFITYVTDEDNLCENFSGADLKCCSLYASKFIAYGAFE